MAAAPVVLLHGFAQSSASWGEVASLLLESGAFTSAYALDFAGHGKSLRADCAKGLDVGCGEGPEAKRGEDLAERCGENPGAAWGEVVRSGGVCSDGACLDGARPDVAHPDAVRFDARAYEMDAACETVRSFVELVACREGAAPALVGYSMGGRIALECLVRYGASARRFCDGVSEGCLAGRGSSSERESFDERDISGGRSVLDAWPRPDGQDALGDRDVPDVLSVSVGRGASGGQDVSGGLLVSALVLESAGLGPVDEAARLNLEKRNAAWARRLREEGVPAFMDYWQDLPLFESQRTLSPARRAAQRAARLSNDAEALARTFEGTGTHRQSAEAASLAALSEAAVAGLPVLFLAGSFDAKYCAVAQRIAAGCDVAQSAVAGCRASVEEPPASGDSPCASDACEQVSAAPLRASSACRRSSAELFSQKMAISCVCGTSEEGVSPDSHQSSRVCEECLCISAGHGQVNISHPSAATVGAVDDAKKVRQIAKNGQKTGNKFRGWFSELSDEGVFGTPSEFSAESASDTASGRFAGLASVGSARRSVECAPEVVVVEGAGHNIHLEEPEEFARILGCFAASAGLAR